MNRKTLITLLTLSALMLVTFPALAQNYVNPDDGIDLNEARSIALSFYPGATVIELDLELERGVQAWDVKLSNGMAVYINVQTGAIIEFEPWNQRGEGWRNHGRGGRGGPPPWAGFPGGRRAWEAQQGGAFGGHAGFTAPPVSTANITFEQALNTALTQYPGTTLVEGELTRRGPRNSGPLAWDMKLSNGMAVYVDAVTGAIIELEPWR